MLSNNGYVWYNNDVRNISINDICGTKHNRDINASINIKKEGMRIVSNPSN